MFTRTHSRFKDSKPVFVCHTNAEPWPSLVQSCFALSLAEAFPLVHLLWTLECTSIVNTERFVLTTFRPYGGPSSGNSFEKPCFLTGPDGQRRNCALPDGINQSSLCAASRSR